MTRLQRFILGTLTVLACGLALPALAADGDLITGSTYAPPQGRAGFYGSEYYLCDGSITNGNNARTCGALMTAPASAFDLITDGSKSIPQVLIFRVRDSTSCSAAWSVDINSATTASSTAITGDVHDVTTLDSNTTSSIVTWPTSATGRYLQTITTTTTDCANLDVTVEIRNWRDSR